MFFRDNLKKSNKNLRHLMKELLRYFKKCEDELNNTLVDELLKQGFDKSISHIEGDLDLKRVHITPDFTEVFNILDTNIITEQTDLSFDLENELELCLEKLKEDANAILAASVNFQGKESVTTTTTDEKLSSLNRQLINETHLKNDLNNRLVELQNYIANLESVKEQLENQNELLMEKQKVLEKDLSKAHEKIGELIESGHKEIVSEGYGEKVTTNRRNSITFGELQEKARTFIAEWVSEADNPVLLLLEDFCKEGDKIMEEKRREREDLMQQVSVLFFYFYNVVWEISTLWQVQHSLEIKKVNLTKKC